MQINFSQACASILIALSLGGVHAQEGAKVEYAPLSLSTKVDFGQIMLGRGEQPVDVQGQVIQRTGVWLTQQATVEDRLVLKMGVGGLFWYSFPELDGAPHTRLTKFGPGISQAQALYKFGDLEKPSWLLQFGLFPYKYNPDARNIGEYLLRSGTYPGFVITGGWDIINSAGFMLQGIRLHGNHFDGALKQDFLLHMERENIPIYDFSPSYIVSYNIANTLEIGAGATYNHLLAVRPSKTTPKQESNGYVRDSLEIRPSTGIKDSVVYFNSSEDHYTFQGLKVMGRLSVDPKLGRTSSLFGPEDLKIFVEAAVLGVEDHPFYYENIANRLPIMFGINIPTFKLFDILSFQMEWYDSQFENSTYNVYEYGLPIWYVKDGDPNLHDASRNKRDNWKWSLYAKRDIIPGLKVYAQVANDHMRPINFNVRPEYVPVTNTPEHWYYLLRVELGI